MQPTKQNMEVREYVKPEIFEQYRRAGLGKGIKEFKNATSDSEVADDLKDIKKEINSVTDDIKKSAKL